MFYLIKGYNAFALSGRFPTHLFTQGDALGWYLAGLSGRLCTKIHSYSTQFSFVQVGKILQLPPYGQWVYDKSLNFLI
jgi:hypothetical protein